MDVMDFTISSVDYNHNNRIYTNLTAPQTEFCKMTITSLTTMANFVVLDTCDYFELTFGDAKYRYNITEAFSDVNTASLVEYMNGLINGDGFAAYYDSCSRIYFTSNRDAPDGMPNGEFELSACSYNMELLLGLVNVPLPLQSRSGVLLCPDVGLYLSTPVLYLACNLGSNSYKNTSDINFTSLRILMRLTNSFFAKQPINHCNGDFTTTVRCTDLSDVRFTLVDANYHEVKLLSPMYLTVQIEAIPDAEDKQFNAPSNIQNELKMLPSAYMHDLSERGRDYAPEEIPGLFIMPEPMPEPQPTD